ncbi:MAG TPA: MFS transporter [Candidatus Omnitrophota bacterium]|jgi:predicted MFS family arabinose efflux permease|nr:MFS transporter [Candidatus Omnitrophota bacterium]
MLPSISQKPRISEWLPLATVFATVYFFSMNGLGALPSLAINFLLKDRIGLTPAQLSYFQAVTLIAWIVKPLWGMISDLCPILGSRRRSYLVLTSLFAAVSWLVLSVAPSYTAGLLLTVMTLITLAYAFQDVVSDGLMVESGQRLDMTGQFQSIQWTAVYIAMIITSFAGGIIADLAKAGSLSYRLIFAGTSLFPMLTAVVSAWFVREPAENQPERMAGLSLRNIFRRKGIWILSFFLFLWNFSPSFGAPFFYYAVDTLKFTGYFLGILQAVAGVGALLGSVLYGFFFARIPLKKFLFAAILLGVAATLSYYIYFAPGLIAIPGLLKGLALTLNFLLGMASSVIFLALLNLAAKASPRFAGGTVFALLMSFYNLGQMGSSALGGFLLPLVGLQPLIAISAAVSLLVLFLLPYLPVPGD